MSEKSKTNKKWTATFSYRENFDKIFKPKSLKLKIKNFLLKFTIRF